jgi:hypothetical protein
MPMPTASALRPIISATAIAVEAITVSIGYSWLVIKVLWTKRVVV